MDNEPTARHAPRDALGVAPHSLATPLCARRSRECTFRVLQPLRCRTSFGSDDQFSRDRRQHAARTQPSCATELRERRFHFFLTCHFSTSYLTQRLVDCLKLLGCRLVHATAPRLDVARDLKEFLLVRFRPVLRS